MASKWEPRKREIEELYIEQKKPLEEVKHTGTRTYEIVLCIRAHCNPPSVAWRRQYRVPSQRENNVSNVNWVPSSTDPLTISGPHLICKRRQSPDTEDDCATADDCNAFHEYDSHGELPLKA
jgi:hypothetical protein